VVWASIGHLEAALVPDAKALPADLRKATVDVLAHAFAQSSLHPAERWPGTARI
jgi:hypothetical protein